jgi:uncharacterized repeat protein (TIGR01451 family)
MQPMLFRRASGLAVLCLLAGPVGIASDPARLLADEPARCDPHGAAPSGIAFHLAPEAPGAWSGVNPAQHLRVRFSPEGVRVTPLIDGDPVWDWRLSLGRYGPPGDLREAGSAWPLASEERFELVRAPLAERFINGRRGLLHSIEVSAFGEPRSIHMEFALGGGLTPKIAEDGSAIQFMTAAGAPVLVYRDLRALDADGRDVSVRWERFESSGGPAAALRLVVEGEDHAFPLNVMGLLATPKGMAGHAPATAALPAGQTGPVATLLSPSNDLCGGAEIIPGDGPFPYLSGAYDISEATLTGDPPVPSCQSNLSRSIWFRFTPVTGGSYTLSLCADATTGSTVEDTVLAVYTATGDCTGFIEEADGCDDDSCTVIDLQSVISHIDLSAGATYYIVSWKYGATAPAPGAAAVQLRIEQDRPPGPAPPNDRCGGAEVIPAAGPFPYLTSVTADIGGATTTGDPPLPSCQSNVSRSIWYSFTPAKSGRYTFSVCADAPSGTTVDDTVMAIYTGTGVCSGLAQVGGACDDDSCISEAGQSLVRGATLEAGITSHIVVWQYGIQPPSSGNTAIQLRVSEEVAPGNDTCGAAPALVLDHPVRGTTANADDDYQLPAGSACFAGIGQTASTAAGRDVAYAFTAPRDGRYSFRVTGFETAKNAVLYVAADCPAGAPPSTIAACLGAANRNSGYPGEEVGCLPLQAGQVVYIYVDESAPTSGSAFTVEVNECHQETEPNDAPSVASAPSCGAEGSIAPGGDADFFGLGIPEAGSRAFAMVDGVASNSTDYDLRVTSSTDTLEYDDLNNDTPFGSVAPNVAGTPLAGAPSFLRISHYSPTAQAEPYRAYGTVQPPPAAATPEVEPNEALAGATTGPNFYYAGALSDAHDVDIFSFAAGEGDLMLLGLDLDPGRDGTPFNGSLALLDSSGATLLLASDNGTTSSTASGNGSLSATTPQSPAEAIAYRVRTTDTYYAKVAWSGGAPGDYLLSIAHGCKISPPTDLAVSLADRPDPVAPGGGLIYTATIRNLGNHSASVVSLGGDLPVGGTFLAATPSQGTCAGSGPVVCHLGTIVAGAQAQVEFALTAPSTPGTINGTARVATVVIDSNPPNDASTVTTTVGAPADTDGDGVPDAEDCAPADPAAWAVPGEAAGLVFPGGAGGTLLNWASPDSPGGSAVFYDLLRSAAADDFSAPTCVAKGITATTASDPTTPPAALFYLVRAKNVCGGNLGTGSDGTPRVGGACP